MICGLKAVIFWLMTFLSAKNKNQLVALGHPVDRYDNAHAALQWLRSVKDVP